MGGGRKVKELSVEDQIYLCKYHDVDSSLFTTIHLNDKEIKETLDRLKQNGLYEQYRNLSDEDYEHIIKREKNKSQYEKILDKYKFDKTNKAYNHLKQVLETCDKYKTAELSMEQIYRQIADKEKVKSYIVNNDCKRILDNTYLSNKEIFEQNQYYKKPSVRDFVFKELNIEQLDTKQVKEKVQENIGGSADKFAENDKSINTQLISDIDNTYVKVPVRTIAEWSYYKGYLDRMLEESK